MFKRKNENKPVVHKQSSYITFMLVPEFSGKVKSLRLQKKTIMAMLSVFVFTISTICIVSHIKAIEGEKAEIMANSVQAELNDTISEKHGLESDNKALQDGLLKTQAEYDANLKALDAKAAEVEEKLKQIEELRQEVVEKMTSTAGSPIKKASYEMKTNVQKSEGIATLNDDNANAVLLSLTDVNNDLDIYIAELQKLNSDVTKYNKYMDAKPSIWPVNGRVTSEFGYRSNPFSGRGSEFHSGIDIKGSTGTPIYAAGSGKVTFSGTKNGYGYVVIIDHGYGIDTYYAHCSKLLVSVGDYVNKKDKIALVGNTGRSTGSHLHYEVRENGTPVNPRNYLRGN